MLLLTGATGLVVHRCRVSDRRSCDPVRFAESVAEQFSRNLPGFTDALMRVSTELSGRSGDIHIEGSASAETVHPHGSVIGVRVSITNVSADEAFAAFGKRDHAWGGAFAFGIFQHQGFPTLHDRHAGVRRS